MPSLTDVAFFLPIPFLFVNLGGAKMLLQDGDTGWHVRTGEWILANHRLPYNDLFSFTRPNAPWFAWEWLWDVIFGWLHLHGGMAAVLLASLLVICLTCALTYRLVLRKCENVLIAFGATLLAIAGSSIHWLARPHLFTLLFVVIFYHILERVQDGRTRLLWWLPFLMILWTNLHSGWIAGLLLILPYAAGELTAFAIEPEPELRRQALLRARGYLLCAAGCLLATFINPYTYRLHLHMIAFFRETYHFENISEFLPLSFHHPASRYFEGMLLLTACALFWSAARKQFVYIFLLLGWAHLALYAGRNIPIFLILAAPPGAAAVHDLLKRASAANLAAWVRRWVARIEEFSGEFGSMDRAPRFHVASALVFALTAAVVYAPAPPERFRAEYDAQKFPAKALAAFKNAEFLNRVCTVDDWGGFVIYRLYPAVRVFVDGRSDFYGQKFEEEYHTLLGPQYNWEKTLQRYRVETVLLPVSLPLVCAMKESRNWRVAYDDGVAIIFRHHSVGTDARSVYPTGPRAAATTKLSAYGTSSGLNRDCYIATTSNRDPRITPTLFP
jgi:hypothetical protein